MTPYREPDPPDATDPCPRCQGELLGVQEGYLHHRRCTRCQGMWIRDVALEKAINDERLRTRLAEATPDLRLDDGQVIRCIFCDEHMRRLTIPSEPRVIIDVCDHGIWLDRGELETIVRSFPPGSDPLEQAEGTATGLVGDVVEGVLDALLGSRRRGP